MGAVNKPSRQARRKWAFLSGRNRNRNLLILGLLGVGFVVVVCAAVVVVGITFWQLYQTAPKGNVTPLLQPASQDISITPVSLPTQECPISALVLGERILAVQVVSLMAEGGLSQPPATADLAYMIVGPAGQRVFLLGVDAFGPEGTLPEGLTQARYYGENCNVVVYQLSSPQPGLPDGNTLFDQTFAGMMLLIAAGPSTPGFSFQGELLEEQITVIEAPTPGPDEIQAEISLLETKTLANSGEVQVDISIHNYGGAAFDLSASKLSLASPGATPLTPSQVQPALPVQVQPGETRNFTIIFPRPTGSPAVLTIIGVEFEIEY